MTRLIAFLASSLFLASPVAGQVEVGRETEPVVGRPCEGCEAVFEEIPDHLTSTARIATKEEPGPRMRIQGTVYAHDRPAPGVIVYAYHTDERGVYPAADGAQGWSRRHGRLRGWAITDEKGRYRFDTIRPSSYPNRELPAHVHMHIIEVGCCTYYIDDVEFEDDPLLTEERRAEHVDGRAGSGLVSPELGAEGVWLVTRDIRLGENIPGYD